MINRDLTAKIENYMQSGQKQIAYGSRDKFVVEINENVDFNEVHAAIDNIVENVMEQDHSFEVIDLLMGYYVLKLFTNIPIPVVKDEDADDDYRPDYSKCNEIVAKLDLMNKLAATSNVVAFYLDVLIKNVWRKLDYNKALLSVMPFNDLMDAIAEFYTIIDEIANVATQDIDLEKFKSTLDEFADKISELQPEIEREKLKLVENDKE